MLEFRTLGSLDAVETDGQRRDSLLAHPKWVALLAYLAVARPRGFQRRDTLAALFWPELDHGRARHALRQVLYGLRQELDESVVAARGDEEVGLNLNSLKCDVWAFEKAFEDSDWVGALEVYRADFLSGFHVSDAHEFERWADDERLRLRNLAATAAWSLAHRCIEESRPAEAERAAQRALQLEPTAEDDVRRFVEAMARSGNRATAVAFYNKFARRLAEEYEIEPTESTREAIDSIRALEDTSETISAIRQDPIPSQDLTPSHEVSRGGTGPRRQRPVRVAMYSALLVGAFSAFAAGWLVFGEGDRERQSVAVLPFVDLSPDSSNRHFSDAITADIIYHLSRIPNLRVTSRTSSAHYRDAEKGLRQIADELGVAAVLEGEVQQIGDRLRINAQLIDAESDETLWARQYNRELSDVLAIQSDVARQVATALSATLTGAATEQIDRATTKSVEAYAYYVRGEDYKARSSAVGNTIAAEMYERAVETDPSFALAYAALGEIHLEIYWQQAERSTDEQLSRAKEAIDKALALDPDLPEAHLALGYYFYRAERDYDRALEHFNRAWEGNPNSERAHLAIGAVQRRRGDWDGALSSFQTAAEISPLDLRVAQELAATQLWMRDYDAALTSFDRANSLAPEAAFSYYWKVWWFLTREGDTEEALNVLRRYADRTEDTLFGLSSTGFYGRAFLRIFHEHYQGLLNGLTLELLGGDTINYFLSKAISQRLSGREYEAHALFDSARAVLEERILRLPHEDLNHDALAIVYAGLGLNEQAVQEAELAVSLLPVSRDAAWGPWHIGTLAEVHAMVGNHEAAIDQLEWLFSIPCPISPPLLEVDPLWDPIRNHPRFQALLAQRPYHQPTQRSH